METARRSIALIAIGLCLVTTGCDAKSKEQLDEAAARLRRGVLTEWADKHLSDRDLEAAVPEPFEFVTVQRNGFERHGGGHLTVGVRMDGPVEYARAIFNAYPDAASALHQFEFKAERAENPINWEGNPLGKPFSDDGLEVPHFCSAQGDHLFWCHVYKGRVYLVIQSSAGWPNGADVTPKERKAAKVLMSAFGTYLEEEIPEE